MNPVDKQLLQIMEQSSDAILFADCQGIIRYWNSGAERMLGYSAQEAVGQSLDLFIPEKLRNRHWEGYHRVIASGETKYRTGLLTSPAVKKDGSQISVEFSIVLLKDQEEMMQGCASIMRDVTERWLREKELKQKLAICEAN